MNSYIAAFSAPTVQSPWFGTQPYKPSLYCISQDPTQTDTGKAFTVDRYQWSGTNRPWNGTPDESHPLTGPSANPGLLGHWFPSTWSDVNHIPTSTAPSAWTPTTSTCSTAPNASSCPSTRNQPSPAAAHPKQTSSATP